MFAAMWLGSMDQYAEALSLVLILRLAHVRLPLLPKNWEAVPVEDLDEWHSVSWTCMALHIACVRLYLCLSHIACVRFYLCLSH